MSFYKGLGTQSTEELICVYKEPNIDGRRKENEDISVSPKLFGGFYDINIYPGVADYCPHCECDPNREH